LLDLDWSWSFKQRWLAHPGQASNCHRGGLSSKILAFATKLG
jgi:hypothetical protein